MINMTVIGHLGRDAVVNTVNGRNVINFTVAHTSKYKDNSGVTNEKTTWVECSYWPQSTGIAPYLTKGTQVYVEGEPDARAYMNKDNQPVASQRCRVRKVELLGSKKDNQQPGGQYQQQAPASSNSYNTDPSQITEPVDDLPF